LDDTIQVVAGAAFEVPLRGLLVPGRFALLEVRNGNYVGDVTSRIVLPPMGPYIEDKGGKAIPGVRLPFIPVGGLPPGDYRLLLLDEGRSLEIKVSKGTVAGGWVHGSARALELTTPKPLNIARVDAGPEEVKVWIGNANPYTRVHVAATRYVDNQTSLAALMAFSRMGGASEIPARLPNLYAAGRDIGDEYRYILERRYAQKFPGNMLARPGLLLNPWEKRKRPGRARPEGDAAGCGHRRGTSPQIRGGKDRGPGSRGSGCGDESCGCGRSQCRLPRRQRTGDLQPGAR
jgi:hypothetical protein